MIPSSREGHVIHPSQHDVYYPPFPPEEYGEWITEICFYYWFIAFEIKKLLRIFKNLNWMETRNSDVCCREGAGEDREGGFWRGSISNAGGAGCLGQGARGWFVTKALKTLGVILLAWRPVVWTAKCRLVHGRIPWRLQPLRKPTKWGQQSRPFQKLGDGHAACVPFFPVMLVG